MRRYLAEALAPVLGIAAVLADTYPQEPVAASLCDRDAGRLVVRYMPDMSVDTPAWAISPAAVRLMSLLVLDKAQTTVRGTRSKAFTCQLKSDRFDVTFEPAVSNVNLLGRCGDAVTGVVTVKRNGVVALDKLAFEIANCHEREQYVQSVTFTDGSSTPDISYVPYDQ